MVIRLLRASVLMPLTVCLLSSPLSADRGLSGLITDAAGDGIAGIKVLVYPVRYSHKLGSPVALSAMGATDVASATTDTLGHFTVPVPADSDYQICTQGARAPLIDRCTLPKDFATIFSTRLPSSSEHIRITLESGSLVVVRVIDSAGNLKSEQLDAVLGITGGGFAQVAKRQIDVHAASFVFTVPQHAFGRLIVRSSVPLINAKSGKSVAIGVPDIPWGAVGDNEIVMMVQHR
jgi:hypothetical protein